MEFNWAPILLTFKLSVITTGILLCIGIPMAYWLSESKLKIKPFFEALISMPLILPPSVLGFYLLIAFNPNGIIGRFLENSFGLRLVFSFEGLVLASVLFSLPFMVHPIQSGFQNISTSIKEAARITDKNKLLILWRVFLPNMKSSIFSGIILSFAHTIGEFGVVLMIGGNIPGVTRVASIAIYDEVEALNYSSANLYAFILFIISFSILFIFHFLNKRIIKTF